MFFNGFLGGIDRYRSIPSGLLGDAMALTVADLSEHIIARRRLYALALGADIELLRPRPCSRPRDGGAVATLLLEIDDRQAAGRCSRARQNRRPVLRLTRAAGSGE